MPPAAPGSGAGFVVGRVVGRAAGFVVGLVLGFAAGRAAGFVVGLVLGFAAGRAAGSATGRVVGRVVGRVEGLGVTAGRAASTAASSAPRDGAPADPAVGLPDATGVSSPAPRSAVVPELHAATNTATAPATAAILITCGTRRASRRAPVDCIVRLSRPPRRPAAAGPDERILRTPRGEAQRAGPHLTQV
jgi:hypothetical protein